MAARAAGGGLRTLLRRVRGPGGGAAEPEGVRGLGGGPPPPGRVENQLYGAGRGPQAPRAPDGAALSCGRPRIRHVLRRLAFSVTREGVPV